MPERLRRAASASSCRCTSSRVPTPTSRTRSPSARRRRSKCRYLHGGRAFQASRNARLKAVAFHRIMLLAKIVGTVVATRKDSRLDSSKLLVVRPMDPRGKAEGNYLVAVDTVDAGVGESVLVDSGSSARMASGLKDCPVDAAIIGIVDEIEISE